MKNVFKGLTHQTDQFNSTAFKDQSIEMLNLDDRNIGFKGAKKLAKLIKKNISLKALYLQGNSLGNEGVGLILEALAQHPAIEEIYLQNNDIDDPKAAKLSLLIEQNKSLKILNLADNLINDLGISAIAPALKTNIMLTEISFHSNKIGDEGAQLLSKHLLHSNCLEALILSNNYIMHDGVKALAELLKASTTLKKLYLSNNKITKEAGAVLIEALANNNTLLTLDVYGNKIGAEGELVLETLIERNRKMHAQQHTQKDVKAYVDKLNSAATLAEKLLTLSTDNQNTINHSTSLETSKSNNSGINTNVITSEKLVELNIPNESALLTALNKIAGHYAPSTKPFTCFVSYAWGNKQYEQATAWLVQCLRKAGFFVPFDLDNGPGNVLASFLDNIEQADFIVVVGTKLLLQKYNWQPKMPEDIQPVVKAELIRICHIANSGASHKIRTLLLEGKITESMPPALRPLVRIENFIYNDYANGVFELVKSLYHIKNTDAYFDKIYKEYELEIANNNQNNISNSNSSSSGKIDQALTNDLISNYSQGYNGFFSNQPEESVSQTDKQNEQAKRFSPT